MRLGISALATISTVIHSPSSIGKSSPLILELHKIIKHIGPVAYKLKLPNSSQFHLDFHVSYIKEKLDSNVVISTCFPK